MYASGIIDTFWADFLGKEGCAMVHFAVGFEAGIPIMTLTHPNMALAKLS